VTALRWGLEAHASRDHTLAGPLWEGCRKSRRCSRDTDPESYITSHISRTAASATALRAFSGSQGYLAHKKQRPPRTLQ